MPHELGVVRDVVLDGRADALLLHARDVADRDLPGQVRVFTKVLKVASVARRAVDVHARAEHVVHAACACVASYACAYLGCKVAVPR